MSASRPEPPLHAMNPLERFSDRAADYVKYRPDYPEAAFDAILAAARPWDTPPPSVPSDLIPLLQDRQAIEERIAARKAVSQRAGTELRVEDVRHVVELIYATGDYADVQVVAKTSPEGVELLLRPTPAPLMAGLEAEGDDDV